MSTTTELQAAGTFVADPVHSHVGFEVPYAVATFSGEVTDFTASLVDGRLEGSAKIESITLKDENLQAHVLSPEFFDAERHPVLTFAGDLVRDGDRATVEGEITMKGITRPATLEGTIVGPTVDHFGATRIGLDLETVVDRTAFDMKWNMPLPSGEPALGNDVTLKADLTLVAQQG
jgi:polyisoprenoid-binding protein YceI